MPQEEEDADRRISIGGFFVELVRQEAIESWQTTSRENSDGTATIYEVHGDAGVDLLIADVKFDNGERDIRMIEVGESDPIFERLVQGLRLGVRQHGDELCVDLGQTRVTEATSARPWSQVYIASADDLDAGFGGSVETQLMNLGATGFGSRSELLGDRSPRRNYFCATFPPGAHLVPLAAYIATRIAPLAFEVAADPNAAADVEPEPLDDEEAPNPLADSTFDPSTLGSNLYGWQRDAIQAWHEHDCRGIVEAVTGAGKTRVAIEAIRDTLDVGARALVLVPLTSLQSQWERQLRRELPGIRIGLLGGGGSARLLDCDVLISTIQTAHRRDIEGIGANSLLVVDEVHRAGAERYSATLRESFRRRLGLSATYERMDGAHETVLLPYFGSVVHSYGYPEAIEDGVISPFRVALIGVDFSHGEREVYEQLTDQLTRAKRALVNSFNVPEEPFEDFINAVFALSAQGTRWESMAASRYLQPFTQRRKLLAGTSAKYDALASLAPAIQASHGSIAFTQTVDAAERTARVLGSRGVRIGVVNGQMSVRARAEVLARFSRGYLNALAAPQVLDEGLDVPEADLGIVVAASKQRRQMIQRMGRVLRRKADGRAARFAILFVNGTSEDPAFGAHEAFLADLLENAQACMSFSTGRDDARELTRFLEGSIP